MIPIYFGAAGLIVSLLNLRHPVCPVTEGTGATPGNIQLFDPRRALYREEVDDLSATDLRKINGIIVGLEGQSQCYANFLEQFLDAHADYTDNSPSVVVSPNDCSSTASADEQDDCKKAGSSGSLAQPEGDIVGDKEWVMAFLQQALAQARKTPGPRSLHRTDANGTNSSYFFRDPELLWSDLKMLNKVLYGDVNDYFAALRTDEGAFLSRPRASAPKGPLDEHGLTSHQKAFLHGIRSLDVVIPDDWRALQAPIKVDPPNPKCTLACTLSAIAVYWGCALECVHKLAPTQCITVACPAVVTAFDTGCLTKLCHGEPVAAVENKGEEPPMPASSQDVEIVE